MLSELDIKGVVSEKKHSHSRSRHLTCKWKAKRIFKKKHQQFSKKLVETDCVLLCVKLLFNVTQPSTQD